MTAQDEQAIVEAVHAAFTEHEPTRDDKRRGYVATAGKGVVVIASVALSAYLSMQKAISDRPTRAEVKAQVTEVQARVEHDVKSIDEEHKALDRQVMELRGEVKALDGKVGDGLDEIKEELRYLRRRR